ncbi:MAG TPA: multiheme c-type cytochrome [Pontiella sp.]|nr:multiheme c-type cytochrome [Pontiella sp.]
MNKGLIIFGIALSILSGAAVQGQTGDPAKLVSVKKCAMCHKKDDNGNQYAKWQSMGHSKAYERLATDEAKAVGAKLGIDDPQSSGACLKCHSTAYYFTEEIQTTEVSVENGVSCQSCHGPGADYKQKSVMENREEAIANGMVYPAKEKSCTLCHNDTSPTWKPDRYTLPDGTKTGFDVEQAYEKIKHERPAN